MPQEVVVFQDKDRAFVKNIKFNVMMDNDYAAMNKNGVGARSPRPGQGNPAPTESFKKYILPSIEKEVNVGKNFAHLRQLYSAIILAVWFKDKIHKAFLNRAGTGTCPYEFIQQNLDRSRRNGAPSQYPGNVYAGDLEPHSRSVETRSPEAEDRRVVPYAPGPRSNLLRHGPVHPSEFLPVILLPDWKWTPFDQRLTSPE